MTKIFPQGIPDLLLLYPLGPLVEVARIILFVICLSFASCINYLVLGKLSFIFFSLHCLALGALPAIGVLVVSGSLELDTL